MILYLKTSFDGVVRKLKAEKIVLDYKNDDQINFEEFDKYSDIEKTGILNLKIHPFESKKWFDSLSEDAKAGGYLLIWNSGAWVSVPGNTIEFMSMD